MNDKVKRNNEAIASTSDIPEQFQAVETQPVSSMSLNSVATQTETGGGGINIEVPSRAFIWKFEKSPSNNPTPPWK